MTPTGVRGSPTPEGTLGAPPINQVRVAYLGPDGTFTSEAARRAAPGAVAEPLPTIPDVVDAVREGRVPLGVVPIENSIEGSVNLTLDALAFGEPGVFIRSEIAIPISMNLLVKDGTALGDVRLVSSMPVALAQCRGWLSENLPGVRLEPSTSTAESARLAAEAGDGMAALGTRYAAERYGLVVLASDIQDFGDNATRFVVLARTMSPATGTDKTSAVFFFGMDRPGQLVRVLEEFALRGINLSKIQSRPTKRGLGEYCIFVDCLGHVTEARVATALRSVHRHVAELRVLGSYPRADHAADVPAESETDRAYAEAASWYADLHARVERNDGSL
ncbi:MAG: prephenate dehydratase [Egibacteraceae bacterium]